MDNINNTFSRFRQNSPGYTLKEDFEDRVFAKIKKKKTVIYCLPGVPAEMKKIFSIVILPILKEKKGKFIEKGFIFTGIGESQIAPYVSEIEEKNPQLWIKTHPRVGISVEVEISITAFNVKNGEDLIDRALNELKEIVLKLKGKIKKY